MEGGGIDTCLFKGFFFFGCSSGQVKTVKSSDLMDGMLVVRAETKQNKPAWRSGANPW